MREPRTPVMIMGEASWEDPNGRLQTVSTCMEDKSAGGACIRVKNRIGVGARLNVHCRHEQFTGIAKYCRTEGREYLVGVQRDKTTTPNPPVSMAASLRNGVKSVDLQSSPQQQDRKPSQLPRASRDTEHAPVVKQAVPDFPIGHDGDISRLHILQFENSGGFANTKVQTKQPAAEERQAGTVRKLMKRKLFDLAHWHDKGSDLSGNGNGGPTVAPATPATENTAAPAKINVPNFEVELLPMEDIYRAAGVTNPRSGHGIHKVVEMLRSEHLRGLSDEMRRAAVLMALDAAGIPVGEVLRDAKARRDALESHEVEQRKQVEAEWARKAEENLQIQAELERAKAHYTARISRNLDQMAREKEMFGNWLTTEQQESQDISRAAELFSKPTSAEPREAPLPEVTAIACAKPM